MRPFEITNADVDALEDVGDIDVSNTDRVAAEIAVAGNNLTEFVIQARFHPQGVFQTLYSSAGDFATPVGILVGTSGDLTALPVGNGWFILSTRGVDAIRIRAAGNNSVVTVRGSGG